MAFLNFSFLYSVFSILSCLSFCFYYCQNLKLIWNVAQYFASWNPRVMNSTGVWFYIYICMYLLPKNHIWSWFKRSFTKSVRLIKSTEQSSRRVLHFPMCSGEKEERERETNPGKTVAAMISISVKTAGCGTFLAVILAAEGNLHYKVGLSITTIVSRRPGNN